MVKKIGVLGAGQLGRMMGLVAPNLGLQLHFLDKDKSFPAGQVSPYFTEGNFTDEEDVYNFGIDKDVVTIEIENVSVTGLKRLEAEGIKVFPQASVIETIKDKGLQKLFYKQHNIPSSAFRLYEHSDQIIDDLNRGIIKLPFVQKSRTEGYDGKGVQLIRTEADLSRLFPVASLVEEMVNIDKELAVIVARSEDGNTQIYPVVEMEFNHEANLLDMLICPARVNDDIVKRSYEIAMQVANAFKIVGILAVELFLTKEGEILVNESAPRAHNSGHHTIDNNYTSQFEQLVRAVSGLPLGSTRMKSPAVMCNVLGAIGYQGVAIYEGLSAITSVEGVKPHLYGKEITKPMRKMGHVNIISNDLSEAIMKASKVKEKLKVISHE